MRSGRPEGDAELVFSSFAHFLFVLDAKLPILARCRALPLGQTFQPNAVMPNNQEFQTDGLSVDISPRGRSTSATAEMRPYFIHEVAVTKGYDIEPGDGTLGDGSYAVVQPAVRRSNGLKVAIKQVHKKYLLNDEEKSAVRREVEIHQRLRHKHIVRLFEVYETQEYLYLVSLAPRV